MSDRKCAGDRLLPGKRFRFEQNRVQVMLVPGHGVHGHGGRARGRGQDAPALVDHQDGHAGHDGRAIEHGDGFLHRELERRKPSQVQRTRRWHALVLKKDLTLAGQCRAT